MKFMTWCYSCDPKSCKENWHIYTQNHFQYVSSKSRLCIGDICENSKHWSICLACTLRYCLYIEFKRNCTKNRKIHEKRKLKTFKITEKISKQQSAAIMYLLWLHSAQGSSCVCMCVFGQGQSVWCCKDYIQRMENTQI